MSTWKIFNHSYYRNIGARYQNNDRNDADNNVLPYDVVEFAKTPVPAVDRVDDGRKEKTEGWKEYSSSKTDDQLKVRERCCNGNWNIFIFLRVLSK